MRTEGDFIKINEWLTPVSWLYGIGVRFRNAMFDMGLLKSVSYDTPVISVGNITVGGTGKTPHVEYLIRLLHDNYRVAVLSRGYKRKSHGYVLASEGTAMTDIGDEPYQMKRKFGDIHVAVDKDRRHGIERLTHDEATRDVQAILLDDAYQHRYVKPGINILLIDYHRMIGYDKLLPAGRLREPQEGTIRADIVIVTKCPADLKPMEYRVLKRVMGLRPFQRLYFTTLEYGDLIPVYGGLPRKLRSIKSTTHVLLLTGIASPRQMILDLQPYTRHITPLTFGDHHAFTATDAALINERFAALPSPKVIVTTEKDSVRLQQLEGLTDEVKTHIFALPIQVKFLLDDKEKFDKKIIDYVRKNSRDGGMA